jgi:hypothetical protein
MNSEQTSVARRCLDAAHFPEIVGRLIAAGFEGYAVDYRSETQDLLSAGRRQLGA